MLLTTLLALQLQTFEAATGATDLVRQGPETFLRHTADDGSGGTEIRIGSVVAGEAALTPLGQSVFGLMYHPELEAGLPVPEALLRARVLLGL